jgi:hypothetical protein
MISDILKCEAFARSKGVFANGVLEDTVVIYVVPEDEVDAEMDLSGMMKLLGPRGQIRRRGQDITYVDESDSWMLICGISDVARMLYITSNQFNLENTTLVVDEGPGFEDGSAEANQLVDTLVDAAPDSGWWWLFV